MHCLRLSCITQISTQQLKPPCWNCTTSHSGILCETALSAWGRTRMRGTTAANSVFGEARHRPHLLRQPQLALPLCGGQLRQRVQRVAVSTPQGKQISRCRREWLRHLAAQGPVREQGVNREVHLRLQRSRHRRGLMTGATNQHRLTRPARTPTWQPWTEKQYAWVPCSAPVGGAPSSTRVPPIGPSVENNMENAKAKQADHCHPCRPLDFTVAIVASCCKEHKWVADNRPRRCVHDTCAALVAAVDALQSAWSAGESSGSASHPVR